jgi:hypothetical protein
MTFCTALPDEEQKAVEPARVATKAVEVNDMMSFLENMAPSKQPEQWRRSRSRSRSDSRERRQLKKKKKRSRSRSRSRSVDRDHRRRRSRSRSGDRKKHRRQQRSRSRDKERDKKKLEELRKMADKMAQAEAPEQFRYHFMVLEFGETVQVCALWF